MKKELENKIFDAIIKLVVFIMVSAIATGIFFLWCAIYLLFFN